MTATDLLGFEGQHQCFLRLSRLGPDRSERGLHLSHRRVRFAKQRSSDLLRPFIGAEGAREVAIGQEDRRVNQQRLGKPCCSFGGFGLLPDCHRASRKLEGTTTLTQLCEAVCERRECFGDARGVAVQRAFADRKGPFEQRQRLTVETLFRERLAKLPGCASDYGMLRAQNTLP